MSVVCVCVCVRSEEHTSELQSHLNLVCRLLLEKHKKTTRHHTTPHTHLNTPPTTPKIHNYTQTSDPPQTTPQTTQQHQPRSPCIFFFNHTATPEFSPLPLHAAIHI